MVLAGLLPCHSLDTLFAILQLHFTKVDDLLMCFFLMSSQIAFAAVGLPAALLLTFEGLLMYCLDMPLELCFQ